MERDRPPRSGIPTFVGSNGRAQSQDKIHDEIFHNPGRVDNVTYQPLNRKEKSIHSSPRPQRNGHLVSNGHVDSQESGYARSHGLSDHPVNSRNGRLLSEGGSTAAMSNGGHYHVPKHRPPTKRAHVTYAHNKRNDYHRNQERELLERSVVGCESGQDCHPWTQPQTSPESPSDDRKTCATTVDFRQQDTCQLGSDSTRASLPQDCKGFSTGNVHLTNNTVCTHASVNDFIVSSNSTLPNVDPSTNASAAHGCPGKCESSSSNYSRFNAEVGDKSLSTPVGVDYPIRGTISPLTNKVAVKRSVGPVDEVSFVFGRPVSPTNEQMIKCSSAQTFTNPGIARCMSPSPGRYMSGHYPSRPMSPNSDILPRRTGTPIGSLPDRRVLSPPPVLGVGSAAEPRMHHQGGICCEHCNGCLVEFKRQALRLMFPDNGAGGHLAQSIRVDNIGERLTLPEGYERWYSRAGHCGVCETPLGHLKQEAVAMVQSIQLAQTSTVPANLPSLVGSCGHLPYQRNRYHPRPGKPHYASSSPLSPSWSPSSMPLAAQAQAYLEQNVRAYINPQNYSQMLAGRIPASGPPLEHDTHYEIPGSPSSFSDTSKSCSSSGRSSAGHHPHYHYHHHQQQHHMWPGYAHPVGATSISGPHHVPVRSATSGSPASSPLSPPSVPSAAVSFFARAAQKLGKKKKRHHSQDQEPQPTFPTNFAEVIRLTPPAAPPCLLRTVGRLQNPGMGKVKVMLKICHPTGSQGEQGASFLSSDPRKKQVTVFDPSASGYVTSANRRAGTAAPKMFAFDSVVTPDDSLTELCASSLAEIIQAVVAGADGCVFTYGYSKLGKTYTMIGSDQSAGTLGVMPCAIAWLFKLINEQKDKTGARFSVRVSAVQVTGKEEMLRDLLSEIAQAGAEATGVGTAPSVYLREDPICGTQLENQSELRAPTADKAAFYLDAALASRAAVDDDDARSSHILFTLNVYQYRIEKANTKAGLPGVAGGRSRLHLIDLGTSSKSKDPNNVSLSLSALGNVVMALLNGQRHVPHRDSKIAQLLRDSLGNLSCRTCMIAHVSSAVPHYNESLQVIQLAARIHRMKRRRTKFSSTSSEDSSTDGDVKFRRPYRGLRMGTLREDVLYSSSHSDPDYTSSSEQSCDTVIYIGANGQSLSDRELTDNEGPPRHVPRTNPRLPRRPSGSRSSGDDSDSGRSMHSVRSLESRLPVRTMLCSSPLGPMAPSRMGQLPSAPGSPNPGLVKMGHIVGLYGKVTGADGRVVASDGSSSSGHWQDKPAKIHCHSSQSKIAKAIHDKQQPLDGELWIDGPGASIYPEPKCSEMWVDGPQAFVVQQQPQSIASSSPLLRDGQHHHHHHYTDTSTRRVATKKVDAEELWIDGPKEMLAGSSPSQPMHTCSKSDYSSKPPCQSKPCPSAKLSESVLKHALAKHVDNTDQPEDVSADDVVEAARTFPPNFHSSEGLPKGSSQHKNTSECSNIVTSDIRQVDASSSPMVSTKKSKLSDSPRKAHPSTQSPRPSPSPSPSMSRKCNKTESTQVSRLQKSQLPGSASPTHRVVQWIKSVSTEPECPESRGTDPGTQQSCQDVNVSMTDAETNTEHDSEFERLAEENGTRSDSDEERLGHSSSLNMKCVSSGLIDAKCNKTMETSLHSSFDVSLLNRESIYEMEIEERLEFMKTKDGSRLAAEVDNETFSSVSCSNKDSDELDRNHSGDEMESLLVQHTKTLTESKQTAQLARLLGRGHPIREASPASCDYDKDTLDASRPLLSRKPDGASNPNLQMIFVEEDSVGKSRTVLPGSSVKAMFVSSNQNDSGVDFPTTSSKSFMAELDDEDSFCENDINMISLSGKGDGSSTGYLSSPKLGAKSKPPLPTKQSPTLKQFGLPKLPTSSQSSANSSPTRSVYCLAKPTRAGKDSQGSPQKTLPSGKMSSPTSRSKFTRGDRGSCSSSTTSHSPQSSVTSSPLVSITSKSSSSSPVQKVSSKNQNGSTSKLPSFCSARTSSPSSKDGGKSRKKEKDFKGGNSNHTNLLSDFIFKGKGNDSDSGNDSGIVAHEKRLLSPYATVTKPRTPSHSSSGHGSDNRLENPPCPAVTYCVKRCVFVCFSFLFRCLP